MIYIAGHSVHILTAMCQFHGSYIFDYTLLRRRVGDELIA